MTNLLENIIKTDRDIIVIIPAEDVLLTKAILPKLNQNRLRQALPYALEEHLIEDVNNLHFAIGEYQPDNTYPVAIISKQKMQSWLDTLKENNITPTVLIPASLALPLVENHWSVYSHNNISTVRTGEYSGFACDTANLATLTADHPVISVTLPNTNMPIPINLLQYPYQAKRKATHAKKIWVTAIYLLLAWITIAFFSHLIDFFILHSQTSKIESAISKIYQRNFPQATAITAPKERMEAKLKALSAEANRNQFLLLLAKFGKTAAHTPGIRLKNLAFSNNQLIVDITATAFTHLDTLINALNSHNLTVKQENAIISGAQVQTTLLITAGTL